MLVLKVLGGFAILILFFIIIDKINSIYQEKFNFKLFAAENIIIDFLAGLCIFIGKIWYSEALIEKGDTLNGILLIGVGILLILLITSWIFISTNFIYGLIGNIINIGILLFFIFIGAPLAIFYIGLKILSFLFPSRTYVKK